MRWVSFGAIILWASCAPVDQNSEAKTPLPPSQPPSTPPSQPPLPPPPITSVNCGSPGSGPWEYGSKTVGALPNQSAPFIVGMPAASCSFLPNEQNAIQQKIVNQATGTPGQRIAIFTMGAPGCGKSSSLQAVTTSLGLSKSQFVNIDPDDARGEIQAFKNATNIPSTACPGKKRAYENAVAWCLERGRDMRDALLPLVITQNKSYIFDSPCEVASYCSGLMQQARNAGFTVYLVAVYARKQTCKDRALSRAFDTGRYTPPTFISQTWQSIDTAKAFKNLALVADKSFVFDNDGATAQKIYESGALTCSLAQPACAYFAP